MSFIADDLIKVVKKEIGYAEKDSGYSKFGEWYSENVDKGSEFHEAPWCDMFIAWAADKAGAKDSVGQFASTVAHAKWFEKKDAFSDEPAPGALIFFDWSKSGDKDIENIDHVGIVEKVRDDGEVQTIEGNIEGGNLKTKVRKDEAEIVGYGRPDKVAARKQENASAAAGSGQDGGTSQSVATVGTAPASPTGSPVLDPQHVAFSGLLVLLLAVIYVTATMARLRWVPVLAARARELPALMAAASAAQTAQRAMATRVTPWLARNGLAKNGRHHRRIVRALGRISTRR